MEKSKALRKKELCIFGGFFVPFLLFGIILLTAIFLARGQGDARFIGFGNYLRLLLADDLFFRALWNTVRWPLLLWLALAAVLLTAKWLFFRRIPRISPAVWDGAVYGLLFVAPVIFSNTVSMMFRGPVDSDAIQIIIGHIGDYGTANEPRQSFISIMATAFITLLLTFIVWCAENFVGWGLSKKKG